MCVRNCFSLLVSHTIKMFHSCFGTDGLFVGQGGNSFGFSSLIVLVDVDGRLAKSAVHLAGRHTAQLVP